MRYFLKTASLCLILFAPGLAQADCEDSQEKAQEIGIETLQNRHNAKKLLDATKSEIARLLNRPTETSTVGDAASGGQAVTQTTMTNICEDDPSRAGFWDCTYLKITVRNNSYRETKEIKYKVGNITDAEQEGECRGDFEIVQIRDRNG